MTGVLAAIRNLHLMNGQKAEALEDPRLKQVKMALAKEVRVKESRDPISSEDLKKIFASWKEDSGNCRMLKAALSLGFFGMLRIGEITASKGAANPAITLDSLDWKKGHLEVKLWRSKSDRTARGTTVVIPKTGSAICPHGTLKAYLEVRPRQVGGPLFLWADGYPLSGVELRKELQAGCRRAGVTGNINGHSLRIGGATALAEKGVSVERIMELGRWKSDSVRRYLKNPKEGLAEIASLMEN